METDAGTDRLNAEAAVHRRPSRVDPRWLLSVAVILTVLAGGMGVLGYLALRTHAASQALAEANAAAVAAAKDCISATQPADAAALPASQQKLTDCSTGDFGSQAAWYGAVLDEAYRAIDVSVQIPEMHAAVERSNNDGSVIALVAFRAIITQPGMTDRQNSYRVRVKMVPDNGTFKIANLDQVAQ